MGNSKTVLFPAFLRAGQTPGGFRKRCFAMEGPAHLTPLQPAPLSEVPHQSSQHHRKTGGGPLKAVLAVGGGGPHGKASLSEACLFWTLHCYINYYQQMEHTNCIQRLRDLISFLLNWIQKVKPNRKFIFQFFNLIQNTKCLTYFTDC